MLILLVDAYANDSKGRSSYQYTFTFLKKIFKKAGNHLHDHYFMERSYNELGDLVIDWEHEHLDKKAQENSIKYDKIDMILVCGDFHVLPWETTASQVVSLLHMSKFMRKPVIAIGFGAYSSIYTFATKGTRFNILNGPSGQSIDELPSYARYSSGVGAHPSAWLDRETGDMYVYEVKSKSWHPRCNIGIHSVSSQSQASTRGQPPIVKVAQYHDMANPTDLAYHADMNRETIRFTNHALQSYLLKDIAKNSRHFVVNMLPAWSINRKGALPTKEKLKIIGEGDKAPLVFLRDRMLLIACKIEASDQHNVETLERILLNYVNEMLSSSMNNLTDKIELSMSEFLFGSLELGHGKYDTLRDRSDPLTPALSKLPIPSSLLQGPVKVDPPVFDMFFRMPTKDEVDYFALTAKRRSSSMGKRPKIAIQNPLNLSIRKMRVDNALEIIGLKADSDAVEKGLLMGYFANPESMAENMPEINREMLSGIVMKDNSISTRRHHKDIRNNLLTPDQIRELDYATIFPPTPKTTTDLQNILRLAGSLDTIEKESMEIAGQAKPADSNVSHQSEDRKVRVHSPSSKKNNETAVLHSEKTASPIYHDQDHREQIYNIKKPNVPLLPSWDRIFLTPNQTTTLNKEIQSSRDKALTPRFEGTTDIHSGRNIPYIPISPWSPAPPSHLAPSSSRTVRTPRTARSILHEALHSHYLPVHRPYISSVNTKSQINPEDSSDEESADGKPENPQPPSEVVIMESPNKSPRSNYKELSKNAKEIDEYYATHYEGYFSEGYMGASEAFLKESKRLKESFLAGEFKVHFNSQKSAMSPRPAANIRSEGPYPKPPAFGHPTSMKAIEWHFLTHNASPREKQQWVAGPWRR